MIRIVQAGAEVARVGDPRVAARWAHLWSRSLEDAAREFGVGLVDVIRQWRALYPGQPVDPRVLVSPRMTQAEVDDLVARTKLAERRRRRPPAPRGPRRGPLTSKQLTARQSQRAAARDQALAHARSFCPGAPASPDRRRGRRC